MCNRHMFELGVFLEFFFVPNHLNKDAEVKTTVQQQRCVPFEEADLVEYALDETVP